MKTRILVWVIVGLLAVAGVIFLIATGNRPAGVAVTLERVQQQAVRKAGDFDDLEQEMTAAQAQLPGVDFAKVGELIAEGRAGIEQVRAAADIKDAEESLRQAQDKYTAARRALKATTKKETRAGGL